MLDRRRGRPNLTYEGPDRRRSPAVVQPGDLYQPVDDRLVAIERRLGRLERGGLAALVLILLTVLGAPASIIGDLVTLLRDLSSLPK